MKLADKLHEDPLCTAERVQCLLVSALEGGSNYWYMIVNCDLAKGKGLRNYQTMEYGEGLERYNVPLAADGAAIVFTTFEAIEDAGLPENPTIREIEKKKANLKTYRLDLEAIRKGWSLLREKSLHHYADVVKENDDAMTGDVFLQLCLFGEVIYG